MKILLVNQFFWPDSAATSQFLTDLAVELAARGHEVHAVCAEGTYALASAGEAPPATIHRVPAARFRRGIAGRILSYASFYVGAARAAFRLPRMDLVLTLTTPPLISLLGTLLKRLRGSRHFIWEMDVYPDVAVSLGYWRAGGLPDRLVGLLADYSRRRSDGIVALGECMRARLEARGIAPGKILVADNWADSRAIQPIERPGDPTELVLLYSGNLGLAHDIDTIAAAMLRLKEDRRFRFLFAGGGPRRPELEAFCEREHLLAAEWRPYVQREALGESLGAGDIGLVTEADGCCGTVVPSKVYGLLAAGRPVLFIGPAAATPARIVQRFGCGWQVECGDTETLVALLRTLAENRDLVHAAGVRARTALLQHFDLPLGVSRVCASIGAFPLHHSVDRAGFHKQNPVEAHGQAPVRLLPYTER